MDISNILKNAHILTKNMEVTEKAVGKPIVVQFGIDFSTQVTLLQLLKIILFKAN